MSQEEGCSLQQVPISALRGGGGVEEAVNKWLRHTKASKVAREHRAQALGRVVQAIHSIIPKREIDVKEEGAPVEGAPVEENSQPENFQPVSHSPTLADMVRSEAACTSMYGEERHCICDIYSTKWCPSCCHPLATMDVEWSPRFNFLRTGPFKGQKVRRSGFVCPLIKGRQKESNLYNPGIRWQSPG